MKTNTKRILGRITAGIMALVLILALAGCAKDTTVTFYIEGVEHCSILPSKGVKASREDATMGGAHIIVVSGDGDYELDVRDDNGQKYPITLKLHNGKVEAETPEGVTVTVDSVK